MRQLIKATTLSLLLIGPTVGLTQKWKEKLNQIKGSEKNKEKGKQSSEKGSNSKLNGFKEVYLRESGERLSTLKLAAEYDLEIVSIDHNGQEKVYSNPNPGAMDFGADPKRGDWKIEVSGGDWEGAYYKLKVPESASDLVNNQIVMTLAHKSNPNKKYTVYLDYAVLDGFELQLTADENGSPIGEFMPGGSFKLDMIPIFSGKPDPSRKNIFGSEGRDYVFQLKGAEVNKYGAYGDRIFNIDNVPFGAQNGDQVIIEVLNPDKSKSLGKIAVQLDYKGDYTWRNPNLSGINGQENANGGQGKNAGTVTAKGVVYNKIEGKKLILIEVDNGIGSKDYILFDPTASNIVIDNSGGRGGVGGDTHNGLKAGNGGNAGNGGKLSLTLSPEAKKMNPNIRLENSGGATGAGGSSYGANGGPAGSDGAAGSAGPTPTTKVAACQVNL